MLKKSKVRLIEGDKVAYAIGEDSVSLAYTLNLSLKRPMADGCLNPSEFDAYTILSKMIHGIIGEVSHDKEILYYCVPAKAVNGDIDVDHHQKVLDQIFKAYRYKDKTVNAFPMNEALALVFAELGDKNYTGFSCSFGSGCVNVCYAIFSQPVFTFSILGSGDWIDKQAAKAINETPIFINKEKTKIDLLKPPSSLAERAISLQYRILIERVVSQIKKAIQDGIAKIRPDNPIDIVVSGGVTSPNGFEDIFREILQAADLPITIGEIRKPKDPLYSVARGLLIAAENAR